MLNGAWVSEETITYLMDYLEKWLEIQVIRAKENINKKKPYRITLKVRDFKI